MILDFNANWRFWKKGGTPVSVCLPHDAMLSEQRKADCRNGVNTGYFPGGYYFYEKAFALTAQEAEKSVVIHFEGVYQRAAVFCNGQKAAFHHYGYTAFDVDISDSVRSGENVLRVEVDNTLEPNCRWYTGSGIYRPVQLLIRDKVHIQSVHMETLSVSPTRIRVDVATTAEAPVRVQLFDGDTPVCEGVPGELEVKDARLWDDENPFLYRLTVSCGTDERELAVGIRRLTWDAREGLCVNGRRVLLRGGCIHHDHGVLGACDFREAEMRRIRILKENGFNAIRFSHNPASQITLDVCDKLGMYVMNETFDGWYIPKTYHDYSRVFDKNRQEDVAAMVDASRNHPSVIMYSVGNEVSETAAKRGVETARELTNFVHSLDNSRPVTAGVNVLLNVYARMGIGVYRDKGDYRPEALPPGKHYSDRKTGSAFFNAVTNKLRGLMFVMSAGLPGDKATRGAADALDVIGLNYASSRYDADVKKYPNRLMVGSETMAADLPYNWERVKKYPQLLGDFVWSAWDYLGEACIGDWTYHSYKGLPLLAGQGMIDITGKPLAAMGFMQVVWGIRKAPFIAVSPLNHAGEIPTIGSWQFTNGIDSWNWPGCEGVKAKIEVFADAAQVRLELNGRAIAKKAVRKYRAVFSAAYVPGELTAVALDRADREISRFSLRSGTAGKKLTVRQSKPVLRADGQDLCYLEIEFTDDSGNLLPAVEQEVDVQVSGAAALAGFGSALCKTDEVFNKTCHNSYRGRCLAVLRAGNTPGTGTVGIYAQGCKSVMCKYEVK